METARCAWRLRNWAYGALTGLLGRGKSRTRGSGADVGARPTLRKFTDPSFS